MIGRSMVINPPIAASESKRDIVAGDVSTAAKEGEQNNDAEEKDTRSLGPV